MKPYLSVVIPAYNEEENYRKGALDQVLSYLAQQKYLWELVIVDDGSTDATNELVHQFAQGKSNVRVVDNPHQGKALAVITGALIASGEIILFLDMDQATPISESEKLLAAIDDGCDIVIGSRAGRKGAPLFRQILAYGQVILRAIILRLPYKDTQCGFKAFKHQAAERIFQIMKTLRPNRTLTGPAVDPGFDVELLYLGRKLGDKICEVPVSWHYQETRRVRFMYDAISGLHGLLLVRWRSLTGAYQVKEKYA